MQKKKHKWKTKCLAVAGAAFILFNSAHYINTDEKPYVNPPYSVELPDDVLKPYASYTEGNVYIGSLKELRKVAPYINRYDVLVVDETKDYNSNFHIIDSYKIVPISYKKEILEILKSYDRCHNNTWCRTYRSLINEWTAHNVLYNFDIKTDHTTDVDLDNNDEEKFKIFTLK